MLGLHLQLTLWNEKTLNLSGVDSSCPITSAALVEHLGFDSMSHYQFVHFTPIDRDYPAILADVASEWTRIENTYRTPYFPHISIGWDNNPRFAGFRPGIVRGNTPDQFRRGLEMARDYLERHPELPPLVTINSWNEWTETSYLEPDDLHGYGYLEAVRTVFKG